MQRLIFFISCLFYTQCCLGQSAGKPQPLIITVSAPGSVPVKDATVTVLSASDSTAKYAALTNDSGRAVFRQISAGRYLFRMAFVGYTTQLSAVYDLPLQDKPAGLYFTLQPSTGSLENIIVKGRRPLIENVRGKVIINVDAAVTNTGTTVLEVLEKSPGITVDRNGTISLRAKTGVLVLIDDKPIYLSGTELSNLLSSMSSSTVDKIELITNPSAKYDASGNAGIINIKTKKARQKGFNGTATAALGQGRYVKNNNSLNLNYRSGKYNAFLAYSMNLNKSFTDIYALRKYYDNTGQVIAGLDQPAYYRNRSFNNTVKAGLDYYLSPATTIGISAGGTLLDRQGPGNAKATWLSKTGVVDSAINTASTATTHLENGVYNINGRHAINKGQEITVDIDRLVYNITNEQGFTSQRLAAGGYIEGSRGDLPSRIRITSAKADYTLQLNKTGRLEAGAKLAHTATDNKAAYQFYNGQVWNDDYGKSNHFLYKENIKAVYTTFEQKYNRLLVQGGLRYEHTQYDADQLGNAVRKDSSFSRTYQSLFPSGYLSYEKDSFNTFTFTAGRRIDRPPFRSLNPFVFIINKYTYQRGNPFYRPQYTWNMELSHQYRQWLTTTVAYTIIKDYFSQLFLTENSDILIYTEGNVGRAYNLGASVAVQAAPAKWWSLSGSAVFNYKKLKGYVWNNYSASISQLNLNLSNQFRIGPSYTAELSGFYTTKARNDLTELLYPTGQLSVGLARPVLKNKGTLKLSVRDIFFTQAMEGLTQFQSADEYFILRRDTRVANLAFTLRFGKSFKAAKRSSGSATDEMQRAGGG